MQDEHLYTEQVQNVLRGAIHGQAGHGDRPYLLLTTFPEEEHGLGLLMAQAILVTEGCRCVSLGEQTSLEDERARALGSYVAAMLVSWPDCRLR